VVICTYGRPDSLKNALFSLTRQTFKDFEVVLITEKGDLSKCRQAGIESARGGVVSLIDDDVYCPPTWMEGVVKSFREDVVGVTGPTVISRQLRKHRDTFKYTPVRWLQDKVFGVPRRPGHLSKCGAPSMESNFESCVYEGPVDYLECCNFSVKRKEALDVGGFSDVYVKTSEWCEVDLSLRLRQKGRLVFSQLCKLYHRPSVAGIYTARLKTAHRWDNFYVYQTRWFGRKSIRTILYRAFVWTYFKVKSLGWV